MKKKRLENMQFSEHIEGTINREKQRLTYLKNFCKWMEEHVAAG